MAQVYRFGLLEDFDHLYRFSALYDRVAGGDANNITQSYSDIMPGRTTVVEHRDPAEVLPAELPEPIEFRSHRQFVRETLAAEVDLRANGTQVVNKDEEPERSLAYREQLNSEGSPTETVAAGYRWRPGTELNADGAAMVKGA
jgi:hypothetical protein